MLPGFCCFWKGVPGMANEPGKIKEQLDSVYEYCFVETVP